jgi:hypothetical protein
MRRYFECVGEEARLHNEMVAKVIFEESMPPFVMVGTDICDSHGPMISPRILDEIYFPNVKKSIQPLLDAGIKAIWHCDGNVVPILHSLVEIGIGGLQGFQEETGVDFGKILDMKTKAGDPLIVFGSISVTTTLPFGSASDVRNDVERCIDLAEGRGGFVLCPANVAQPDVSVENIFAMYKHALKYGKGK